VKGPDSQRMNQVCNDQPRQNAESASRNATTATKATKATKATIRKKR